MNIKFRLRKKNRKKLPVSCVCRNCGTQQISRYCHNCGQDLFSGSERSLKEIIENTLDTVFAFDNKILRTLKYLLFYPGKLTKEYFAGKIVRYVFPSKLFWFMSLLFFATISSIDTNLNEEDIENIIVTVKEELSKTSQEETNIATVREVIKDKLEKQMKEKNIMQTFFDYMPYVVFLLIPFFALITQALYFRKCTHYAYHMIFALHFHAFVFLFLTLTNVLEHFFPVLGKEESPLGAIRFLTPAVYLVISLYVVFRPKKRNLLWKIPVIMVIYAIAMLIATILLVIVVSFIEKPEIITELHDILKIET